MVKVASWSLPRPRRNGPPFHSKSNVIMVLEQVGVLLELKGANPFRVRSYQNASRTLGALEEDLWVVTSEGRLTDVKGIGKGIAGLIAEALTEGTWGEMWALYTSVPPGLIQMLAIPGLGPKRIKQFHEELGIESIEQLKVSAENGELRGLSRMGEKSEQKVLDGIELLKRFSGRRRLDVGLLYGEALEARIATMEGVERAQLAGSTRRRKETIGDLDIVAAVLPEDVESVTDQILTLPGVADVKGAGSSKVSIILGTEFFSEEVMESGLDGGVLEALGGDAYEEMAAHTTIDAQIRLVPPHVFAYTLAYFTGSKEHNVRMRQRSLDQGLRLNEFGLFPLDAVGELKGMEAAEFSLPAEKESDIYSHLNLQWVPPELREDSGEIEAAEIGSLPDLMEPSMLKGAFHNHTTASDGTATLSQMAEAAQNLGWEFLGIADHSQILQIASGLSPDELVSQAAEVRALNENWADKGVDFRLFHGNECDILPDGGLDYTDEERKILDHVVGSVHQLPTWMKRDEDVNTEALIRAIENPSLTILGHPTGRILGGRDGFAVDLHAVIRRMGELNAEGELKVVEINASPYRLDLDWRYCRFAKEQGVPISINPDAHSRQGLKDVWFGAQIARKGWLEETDILNCRSGSDLEQLLW
ncbi:MAG TPA: helix-hairpin-helix domain-containing protein [Candidatus Thalassarchaeaceae archaeon]|nr:helix-hairpin-helix domain-containing protein [Candidatus Thalassarchaeaceae archaeon]